jgi:hypothetical protein
MVEAEPSIDLAVGSDFGGLAQKVAADGKDAEADEGMSKKVSEASNEKTADLPAQAKEVKHKHLNKK